MNSNLTILLFAVSVFISTSCSKIASTSTTTAPTEDTSTSGSVASSVGGALSSSDSGGTVALNLDIKSKHFLDYIIPSAMASACPSAKAGGAGCLAGGNTIWLTYSGCSYGSSPATWTGTEALTRSAGATTCGTFPAAPASGTLIRQIVTGASSTTPSTATRTTGNGLVVTIDHATANLGNFDTGATVAAIANGGFGKKVTFAADGSKNGIIIAEHITSSLFDHSITGTLSVTETPGATSRSVSGTIKTYHNLVKVIATSVLTGVTHSNTCCTPVSGSIATSFSTGVNVTTPTALGALIVGKSETLTFTGCGTATLAKPDGSTVSVTNSHCF